MEIRSSHIPHAQVTAATASVRPSPTMRTEPAASLAEPVLQGELIRDRVDYSELSRQSRQKAMQTASPVTPSSLGAIRAINQYRTLAQLENGGPAVGFDGYA